MRPLRPLLPPTLLLLAAATTAQEPAVAPTGASAPAAAPGASIDYQLWHDPGGSCWRVDVRVTGLEPEAGDVVLALEDWGEWTEVEGFLRHFAVRPPAHPEPDAAHRFVVEAPPDWDGTLEVSYVLPLAPLGSPAHESHSLLPVFDGSTARGFSSNTLIDVLQAGQPLAARRTLRLMARPGVFVATGWAGVSECEQIVRLEHPIDNVPLIFGSARTAAADGESGLRYEVVQLGDGPDVTQPVLDVVRTLVPLYARHCGRRPEEPVRLFITPWEGGGTATDHGIVVSAPDVSDAAEAGGAGSQLSPESIRLLAHELFHLWLGGFARPDDESIVWFHEGFTEYFAIWHVAASGLASREWFAERIAIMDAEARGSAAHGRLAFGDPDVRWRDDDGPSETLGYSGGALLAFAADVELRRQGRPGLLALLAELMEQNDQSLQLARVREAMEDNGLEEFWAQSIARPARFPDVDATLASLGFELSEGDAALTYLGIQVEDEDHEKADDRSAGRLATSGLVVAVDPEGPAAQAGVRVGDEIMGCSPGRNRPPRVRQEVATPYRFGLTCIASGAEVAVLEVRRDGAELTMEVAPRLVEGGVRTAYRAGGKELERFFEYRPAARTVSER